MKRPMGSISNYTWLLFMICKAYHSALHFSIERKEARTIYKHGKSLSCRRKWEYFVLTKDFACNKLNKRKAAANYKSINILDFQFPQEMSFLYVFWMKKAYCLIFIIPHAFTGHKFNREFWFEAADHFNQQDYNQLLMLCVFSIMPLQ